MKKIKPTKPVASLKHLVMAYHPASCRSIQNTISQLRNDLARHVA